MILSDEYLAQAKQRALRFAGCLDAGTSGALAGDIMRLLSLVADQRKELESMRDTPTVEPAAQDWILRGEAELKGERPACHRLNGDGLLAAREPSGAEVLLDEARNATMERRANYGPPREHFARTVGAINAVFAAKLREPLTPADWALIMLLDKAARYMGDRKTRDQIVDMAGYAGCLAECDRDEP